MRAGSCCAVIVFDRFGSFSTDAGGCLPVHVRFASKADQSSHRGEMTRWAINQTFRLREVKLRHHFPHLGVGTDEDIAVS